MNKKGITLIEIIISIVLISIVLIFLFSLLVMVRDINDESEINSTYLINKSLILKNIESDLSKAGSVNISKCEIPSGNKTNISSFFYSYDDYYNDLDENQKAHNCIKFNFGEGDDGYLGIYYYKNNYKYI